MRIPVLFLILVSCCFIHQASRAQGENMNWHYGKHVSLNFGQLPLTVSTSQINTIEGCAAVSDALGNLLFYTTGFKIWDRNGVEMPNATGLLGNGPIIPGVAEPVGSGYKSVHIIKHPGNRLQYFVISGDAQQMAQKKLYYHVVDMSLNNGLGDVLPGQKNIEIMNNVSESLCVLKGADCSTYWLVAPVSGNSNQYYTFKIDAAGLHTTPVISGLPMNFEGYKEVFPTKNGNTVVGISEYYLFSMEFNGVNGTFSNFDTISTSLNGGWHYNTSPGISKDKTKFYFGNSMLNNLYQVDLNLLPNLSAVKNSMVEVVPAIPMMNYIFYLRTDPVEDKIYFIRAMNSPNNQWISSLSNASQPAAQVVLTQNALPLFPPNTNPNAVYFTLGTDVVSHAPSNTVFSNALDTVLCNQLSYSLTSPNTAAGQFEWNTGATTAGITVSQSGTFWVKTLHNCLLTYDTFKVHFANPEVSLPQDTQLCAGKSMLLQAATNADRYLWNTGDTSSGITVSEGGTYYVEVSQQGCKASDTIYIQGISSYVTILQNDTLVCSSMPVRVNAVSNLESTYRWNDGTTGPSLQPAGSGQYIVTATNQCGIFTDEVNIEVIDCLCKIQVPNAFSPNGDGLNDILSPVVAPGCHMKTFDFRIYNRFGQLVFTGVRPGQGWDGYFKNRPAETGNYIYYLDYKDLYSGDPIRLRGDITLMR